MPYWQNWSGRLGEKVRDIHFARSQGDITGLIGGLGSAAARLRVAGAGHSHAPLVVGTDRVLDLSGLSGVIACDQDRMTATIRAGTPIYTLGAVLQEAGMALKSQGDIDRQTLAGACATGTHGSGRYLQNLSASIESLTLVDGQGKVRVCSASHQGTDFEALKVGLGVFGVVTEIEIAVRESFKLKEQGFSLTGDELMAQLEGFDDSHDRFEFFWQPQQDQAMVKIMVETDEEPVYPVAEEGKRCAYNYEVLPNHRPHRHTEMEYSIAAEHGPACFAEIRALLQTEFQEVAWPVEYRRVAQDDVWLSNAYQRDTVTISVHQDVNADETQYYQACETIFKRYRGRPHWGKVHYLEGAGLADLYPKWREWWQMRDTFDPKQRFLNDFLRAVRPS